ncbi:MAG TPA: dNTP triphosphohydrolase [Bryobacteraceae bacterium]|nr:dNTP triphosphohydrolase [Bryobacteraceae bacterium]
MLRRLRLPSQTLHGRRFPELSHPYRNDFQRDRDRIIHSRAFRRLEGKTQVFSVRADDHIRNRLTHTIEVSQVARTLAVALELNEEYTETLALAHDLGHPPFGHVGERELDRQMRRFGSTFEHNLHSLRIVDLLEERYPRFAGLNLTFEVREGIVKHSREIEPGEEVALQEFLPGQRPALEAQLLDAADEIAYTSADLDDSFATGLIRFEDLREYVPAAGDLIETAETQYPGTAPRIRFWEVQRQLMNLLIDGLLTGTLTAVERRGVQTIEEVRALDERLAAMSPETTVLHGQLKTLLWERAYSRRELVADRNRAAQTMKELFEFLIESPDCISLGYREHLEDTPVHRVVCDYIAGMTDAYLDRVHRELLR